MHILFRTENTTASTIPILETSQVRTTTTTNCNGFDYSFIIQLIELLLYLFFCFFLYFKIWKNSKVDIESNFLFNFFSID